MNIFSHSLRLSVLAIVSFFILSCDGNSNPKTWTLLIYMDGDNNLSDAALDDLLEMEAVGSSKYVNVIVQLDLSERWNTKTSGPFTTQRYRVVKSAPPELIEDLGELDMASPETLADFLVWGKENYPADRNIVILWNHGNGWDQGDGPSPRSSSFHPASMPRSIFYDDDNDSEFLSNSRVGQAIKDAEITIDILGLDASIMGTIEAMYEFRDLSPILISSQEVGHSSGWDYTSILSRLEDDPGMDVETFSRNVVNSYRDFFERTYYPANPSYEQRHTITAMRTEHFGELGAEVDNMADHLSSMMDNPETSQATLDMITNVRFNSQTGSVQEIDRYVTPYVYIDLFDLDNRLVIDTKITEMISDATIAEYHGSARPEAHGVSIVFFRLPDAKNINTFDPDYKNYDPDTNSGNRGDFINSFGWDEFLEKYYTISGL